MQDWSSSEMKPQLTAQAPRATWFWVELTLKGHRILKLSGIKAGTNSNTWPTQSFKTFLFQKQIPDKNPSLHTRPSLQPLFLPSNFNFPIGNLMTECSQGEELGRAIPNTLRFHLLFHRIRGKSSLSKYNTAFQTLHLPSRVERERNVLKTWLAKRKEEKIRYRHKAVW